jgi:predicted lipoprotein with Yx(FWY)xxD motif
MRRAAIVFLAAALAAAVIAATAWPATSGPATVKTRSTTLGRVLVDGNGRTLYVFGKDKGHTSTCTGACASAWPPLITHGTAKAASAARGSMLGTTRRADGRLQVTYNGHPVYKFAEDKQAGDTSGEGLSAFGGKWFALSASGHKVEKPQPSSPAMPPSPYPAPPAPPGY